MLSNADVGREGDAQRISDSISQNLTNIIRASHGQPPIQQDFLESLKYNWKDMVVFGVVAYFSFQLIKEAIRK